MLIIGSPVLISWTGLPFAGVRGLSDRRPAVPLGRCQELSPCQVQLRQATPDLEPVGILREPTISHLGPPNDAFHHQEDKFDLGPHLRLGPIAVVLRFTQGPMSMGVGLDEALGLGGVLLKHLALSAIGGIAPDACLLTVQQLR